MQKVPENMNSEELLKENARLKSEKQNLEHEKQYLQFRIGQLN